MDTVAVDGVTVNLDPSMRYYALHKPPGVVTTMNDPQGRPDIRGFLPADGPRVFPVGRLDRDTEGLLLLTNDGELANRLLHPRYAVEKEYLAEVEGAPSDGRSPGSAAAWSSRTGSRSRRPCASWPRSGPRGALRLVMTGGAQARGPALAGRGGTPGGPPGARCGSVR